MTSALRDGLRGLAGVLALSAIASTTQQVAAQQDSRYPSRSRWETSPSRFQDRPTQSNSRYPFRSQDPSRSRFSSGSQYPVRPAQFRQPAAQPSQPRGGQFQGGRPRQTARQHPLVPAIALARRAMTVMKNVQDYECTLAKRHRNLDTGKMRDLQHIYLRVRHKPFSVYMYFLTPAAQKGQQVVYVEGANKDRAGKSELVAQPVGLIGIAGPYRLDIRDPKVMKGQRYPITMVGFKNLTVRLLEVAENDKKFGECDVKIFNRTMVNKRSTTCIRVYHPVPRDNFRFHIAKIFIDDELGVPIRYEAYMWPKQAGGKPVLDEEYTYHDVKTNLGFTDADFVIRKK